LNQQEYKPETKEKASHGASTNFRKWKFKNEREDERKARRGGWSKKLERLRVAHTNPCHPGRSEGFVHVAEGTASLKV
jgi:hypothetical protein